jgi:very-short-patch-repair endonuclease
VYRGVYAVGHEALPDRGRVVAALLAAGPRAMASHRTAAALYGLTPSMPAVLDVTVHGRAGRSRRGLKIHEASSPPAARDLDGLPVTAPLRTLEDLAATRPPAEVDRATAEALVRRLVRPEDLPGGRPPTRSELERRMLTLIAQSGLPRPLVNHRIHRYVVDFAWPDHRVVAETDGYAAHGHRAAFEADRARDAALHAHGYAVIRFTWRQIDREPIRTAALLAQVLAQAAAASPSASNMSKYSSPVASATGR